MTLTLTYSQLKALSPCEESLKRVAKLMGGARKWTRPVTASEAQIAGAAFDDIVWAAAAIARTDKDVERRLRLWMADCASHVLQHFEAEFPSDGRAKNAIIAARRFARGEIEDAAWAAAGAAAWAAARDAARAAAGDAAGAAAWAAAWAAARDAARAAARDAEGAAAWASARASARDAARAAAWAAARDAARDAEGDAEGDAAWAAARDAEGAWQYDRLVLWLSEVEPDDWEFTCSPKVEGRP